MVARAGTIRRCVSDQHADPPDVGLPDAGNRGPAGRRNGWQAWRNWTGRLWHAYRAKFATEMVDVPDRVLAKLGGWKNPRSLDIYQQPSDDVMLEALEQRRA